AGRLELAGDAVGGLAQRGVRGAHGDDPRAVGRERRRPDHAGVVVVLLDRRSDSARDADPVAAHLDRALHAVGAEEARAHRRAVLRAEVEDLSDLDAAVAGEHALLAARAAVAGARLAQVGERRIGEVARLVDADDVRVVAVGTRHHAARAAQRRVREDRDTEPDGPRAA